MRLVLKRSFPTASKVVDVPDTTTIQQVVSDLHAAFEIEEKESKHYVVAVPFEADIIDIADKQTSTLKDAGIPDGTTFLIVPPAESRPPIKVVPMPASAQPIKQQTTKMASFKGLDVATALNAWVTAPQRSAERKSAFAFIEMYGSDILKQPGFAKLSLLDAAHVLGSDQLRASEEEVFQAVLDWTKANNPSAIGSGATALSSAPLNLKYRIRLAHVSMQFANDVISPSGLIDPADLVQLFVYLLARDQAIKEKKPLPLIPAVLSSFDSNPRIPRLPPHWFTIDTYPQGIQVTEDGTRVRPNKSLANPALVTSSTALDSGVWEWKVTVNGLNSHTNALIIGLIPAAMTTFPDNYVLGTRSTEGSAYTTYAFQAKSGSKTSNGNVANFGLPAVVGSVYTVRYESASGDFLLGVDGKQPVLVYSGVTAPVKPAFTVFGEGTDIKICFDEKIPE